MAAISLVIVSTNMGLHSVTLGHHVQKTTEWCFCSWWLCTCCIQAVHSGWIKQHMVCFMFPVNWEETKLLSLFQNAEVHAVTGVYSIDIIEYYQVKSIKKHSVI